MTSSPTPASQTMLAAELERIVELERVIRAAQAEQLRRIEAARVLAADVDGVTDASTPVDREFATRSFVAELATTLVVHEATAGRLIADAHRLAGELSATLDALQAGSIGVGHVRSMLEVAVSLPAASLTGFEAAALERAERETPSAFRRRIRRLRERMHPEPLTARHRRARDERRVCLEPAEDGMAWLSLHLEAERGVAIMARLDALADARVAEPSIPTHPAPTHPATFSGEQSPSLSPNTSPTTSLGPRTRAQLVLDIAADLLLGREPASDADSAPLGVVRPHVYVTVPVLTLLGRTDESAELDGYGPIDAETARRLAAHAPSFQRILTHPETGAYLSYGRNTYRVPADLAGYLRVRDGGCRFPGCSRRAAGCDLDHTRDWAAGGATRHDNLAHLCRKHHRLKHHTEWRMSQMPSGDIRWTSPAGLVHVTTPDQPFDPVVPALAAPADAPVTESDPEPPWAVQRPESSSGVPPAGVVAA